MRKLNLLLVDKDEEYLAALANYLTTNYFLEFRITSISNEKYLREYLDSVQGVDILLISREFYNDSIEDKFINTIIKLGEEPRNANEDLYYIFKYKQATKIYNDIKSYYLKKNPHATEEIDGSSKNTKVISCYSPIGGIGKSLVSIATLLKLRESSRQVLYLNFEDVPVTSVFFKCNKKSMSDLLYLAKDRDINLKNKIIDYLNVDNNGIYYFSPIESVLDYETITRDDVIYFLNSIKSLNKFDIVMIDMSSKFDSIYAGLLGISSNIISILGTDLQGKTKMDIFLKQQESLDKFIFIMNKYKNSDEMNMIPETMKQENKSLAARLDYYDVIDGNVNGIDILIENNPFTSGVEQIVKKLFFA